MELTASTDKNETIGVLIAVTVRPGTNIPHIIEGLAQECSRHGDIIEFDVENLGTIECYDETGVVKES